MKQTLLRFKALAVTALLFGGIAPRADAWTARSLAEYCNGNAIELLRGQGNQNSLLFQANTIDGVGMNTKVSVGYATNSDGVEVFVIQNFLGAFQVECLVYGNTIEFYQPENYVWKTTTGKALSYDGSSGVNFIQLRRVIRVDAPQASGLVGLHADRKVKAHGYADWNYAVAASINALSYSKVQAQSGWNYTPWYNNRTSLKGTITTDANGNVIIEFGPYNNYYDSNSFTAIYYGWDAYNEDIYPIYRYDENGNYGQAQRMFDGYILTLYKANAIAVDNKNPDGYEVKVSEIRNAPQYNFGITNFANLGMNYANFNVNTSQTNGGPTVKWDIIKGKISGDKIVIPQQNVYAVHTGRMGIYNSYYGTYSDESAISNLNVLTVGFDPATQQPRSDKAITGTLSYGVPRHDEGMNSWHHQVAGGARHTYVDTIFNLDPFGFTDNASMTTSWGNTYQGLSILAGQRDITFDCKLEITAVTHDPEHDFELDPVSGDRLGYYRVSLRMSDFVNPQFVSELAVYAVPGVYSDYSRIDMSQATFIGSLGTVDGDLITLPRKIFRPTFVFNEKNHKVEEMKTEYTFFVRARYKTDTEEAPAAPGLKRVALSLTDTHHAPRHVSVADIPTGVSGPAAAPGIDIRTTPAGIMVVAPSDCPVEVFNAGGFLVARGVANTEIPLAARGIYLVRAGSRVFKILK